MLRLVSRYTTSNDQYRSGPSLKRIIGHVTYCLCLFQVLVNDQPVELPFTQGKVEAIREDYHITVDDGAGLTVEVDPVNDIYTIGLSGWYHGRVAGLLGTFDNENSNDMLSINRQKLTDVTDFANSWEVGRRSCRASNKATDISMANVDSIYPECVAYFKAQTSQFRPCFSVVSQSDRQQIHSNVVTLMYKCC